LNAANLDEDAHGPVLGERQNCTGCHDGADRGALRATTATNTVRQKVILELSMPPEDGLPELLLKGETHRKALSGKEADQLDVAEAQHAALLADFLADRAPTLRAWLRETACE
jgi:hypothetical protein